MNGAAATRPSSANRRERGFTLLEFVVAATILALLAAVMLSGFRMTVNSYQRSQQRLDEDARRRILEDLIRRQVGSLFPLAPTAGFAQEEGEAALTGQIVDPNTGIPVSAQQSQIPLFYGTDESMTFVTVAPLSLLEHPGLAVVRYGLAEDEWGRRYFGQLETRFSGLDSFQRMVEVPPGKPYPLVENVESLHFQYYGWDASREAYVWYDHWHGDEMFSVPSAVRITADHKEFLVAVNASFFGGAARGLLRNLIRN